MFSASCDDHSDSLCICNSEPLCHESAPLRLNGGMRCIGEIRRLRLLELLASYKQADLNRLRGKPDRDSTLSQYVKQAPESSTGKPRQVGDSVARELEQVTGKPVGWMDRDPLIDELEARISLRVEEPRARYGDWPFTRVTPEQWRGLPAAQQHAVESLVLSMLPVEARH